MKQLFCVCCQTTIDHALSVVNHEFHATCSHCDHVVKFPQVASAIELQSLFDAHNRDNVPVLTAEKEKSAHDELQAILDAI